MAVYRAEMAAANRAYIQGKVDALYDDDTLTERQRLNKLAPLFGSSHWPTASEGGFASDITSPRQLVISAGESGYVDLGVDHDGTSPPQPEPVRKLYLDQLHELLRQVGDQNGSVDIELPAEFAELLTMTDAITTSDFRQSGAPGLEGTCNPLNRMDMSDRASEAQTWYREGWHVLRGWHCAYANPVGATYLLYARKPDGSPEEQEFRWCVYSWDENELEDGLWFASIADYLLYTCQWLSRLPAGWQHEPARRTEDMSSEEDGDEHFED